MTPHQFLKFASISFQREITYRFDYFVAVINGFLYVFIFTSVWKVIFAKTGEHGGFNTSGIVTYAVMAMVIRISFSMDDTRIASKVRDGSVSMDLIRPVSFYLMNLAESVGFSSFHFLARGIPILALSAILFHITVPAGTLLLGTASLFFSYLILYMMNFATGLISFWIIEIFPFMLLKYGLINFLSGGIVPIDFFPPAIRPLLDYLPFQYIFYTPASILTGHITGHAAAMMLVRQAAWSVAIGAICGLLWRAGRSRLVVQGG